MQKKISMVVAAAAVVALCASTAAFAYLTNADNKEVAFTVGDVGGMLVDTPLSTAAGEFLSPGETLQTAPKVQSDGKGDAIVFVEMQVPAESVKVYSESEGTVSATPAMQALFEEASAINSDWTVYNGPSIENGIETTVFACKKILPSEGITSPIFENLRVINATSMSQSSYQVKFNAKMIQAEGIGTGTLDKTAFDKAYTALGAHGV